MPEKYTKEQIENEIEESIKNHCYDDQTAHATRAIAMLLFNQQYS